MCVNYQRKKLKFILLGTRISKFFSQFLAQFFLGKIFIILLLPWNYFLIADKFWLLKNIKLIIDIIYYIINFINKKKMKCLL